MKKEKTKVENTKTIENVSDKPKEMPDQEKEMIDNEQIILEKEMAKKKVPKEVSQGILKKIFKNLILAIVVMAYFIACNILYTQLNLDRMELITKAISGVFLVVSIVLFELAYKRDSGTLTITAIELLILSIHALFIHHVITIYQFNYQTYILTSSYIFAIYYVLKSIIIYTKARRKYVKSLSDISEIVKEEPVIKEAKKREVEDEEKPENIEENVDTKKKEKTTKRKTKTTKAESEPKKTKKKQDKEDIEKATDIEETVIVEEKPKRKRTTKKKEESEIVEKPKKKSATKKKTEQDNENKETEKKRTTKKKKEATDKIENNEEETKKINQEEITTKPTKPKSKRGRKKKTVEK